MLSKCIMKYMQDYEVFLENTYTHDITILNFSTVSNIWFANMREILCLLQTSGSFCWSYTYFVLKPATCTYLRSFFCAYKKDIRLLNTNVSTNLFLINTCLLYVFAWIHFDELLPLEICNINLCIKFHKMMLSIQQKDKCHTHE